MSDSQTPMLEVAENNLDLVSSTPLNDPDYCSRNDSLKIRVGITNEATELPEGFKWPDYHPVITDNCQSALFKYAIGGDEIEKRWQYAIADILHYDKFGRPTRSFPVSWFFRHLSAPQARILDLAADYDPDFRKGNKVDVDGVYDYLVEEYPSEISQSIFKKALKSLLRREILSGYHTMNSQVFLRFPIDNGKMCFKAENLRLFKTLTRSNVCVYCGKWLTPKNFSRDHIDPKVQGGAKESHNIVHCCERCNNCKGGRTPEEWALDILNYKHRRKYQRNLSPFQSQLKSIKRSLQQVRARFVCFVFAWARG